MHGSDCKIALVTGASGFIGHHLLEWLICETNWKIFALDRQDSSYLERRTNFTLHRLSPSQRSRIEFLKTDLREFSLTQFKEIDPQLIFHLAAESHVDRGIENPVEFAANNVMGTVRLLELARAGTRLERFLYYSTDEVFGPAREGQSFAEYDRYNSTNPYSASKAAAEEFCVAYRNSYELPVAVLHLMNVFGERQHPEKFIPKVMQKVLAGEPVVIHIGKNGQPLRRHFVDVRDVCKTSVFIAQMGADIVSSDPSIHCPKINLIGREETDCLTLAREISQLIGQPLRYDFKHEVLERPHFDERYALAAGTLERLGWKLDSRLSERLPELVKWTLQHPEWIKEDV